MNRDPIRPLLVAGVVLGIGFAAFFDGIVLHQILNWHHMICDERTCVPESIADLEQKNKSDGYFHLFAFLVMILGTRLLYRVGGVRSEHVAAPGAVFGGGLLGGIGGFNVAEGIVDHHLLRIHHVRFGPHRNVYDVAFLVLSAAIYGIGLMMIQRARMKQRTLEPLD